MLVFNSLAFYVAPTSTNTTNHRKLDRFTFPKSRSTVLPDPSSSSHQTSSHPPSPQTHFSKIYLTHDASTITSENFRGVIRIALLSKTDSESVLDRFSSSYPVSGHALFRESFSVRYRWKKKGLGDLLMLANPLHIRLLDDSSIKVLNDFRYKSIDGELVGVVGSSWVLKTDPVSVTWHSIKGVQRESYPEIIDALVQDVKGLNSTRLALIAEEVDHVDVIPKIKKYLKDTIEPWLDGTFAGNSFLYDKSWGGLITKQGSTDRTADFGFGIYNDHHFHIGYYLYGIAVLAKTDPIWGRKYKPQAYSLMLDFMTLRRNQESTSEAVNAYYSVALMGLAYEDPHLVAFGSLLTTMEIHAAQTWWHVKEDDTLYAEFKEIRLGIQVLPLLPITEILFSDVEYVKQLVDWSLPSLKRKDVGEGWKGFVYALEGIYEKEVALKKIRNLKGHDDGNSFE
ncbi:hypothetical protein E3N88_45239 [Mikania micrantha]|uniref:glucan endo-1,3-beta-D-glucosidase n=1 Tax=Mikania micrantha TaxID=192012 RepID=A0A5N6L9Z3_9ASTR|nr:hypothetical protein E3N88_45239 [Mikania micrantha]